jgi:hemerythrin-like domain-containing protein
MAALGKKPRVDLRALLSSEHAALEQRFEEILAAFRANAREEVIPLWTSFEKALVEHMELEEEIILPELAKTDPGTVEAIEAEHAQICEQLGAFGISVDLHRLRADHVDAFVQRLKEHARREDQLVYRWAEEHLAAAPRRKLLDRLLRRPAQSSQRLPTNRGLGQ